MSKMKVPDIAQVIYYVNNITNGQETPFKYVTKAYSVKEDTLKFYKEELERFSLFAVVCGDFKDGFSTIVDGKEHLMVIYVKDIIKHGKKLKDGSVTISYTTLLHICAYRLDLVIEKVIEEIYKPQDVEVEFKPDVIVPNHYKTQAGVDVIDFCEMYGLDFTLGNVVKYVCRAGKKENNSAKQDLMKAKEYIERKLKTL